MSFRSLSWFKLVAAVAALSALLILACGSEGTLAPGSVVVATPLPTVAPAPTVAPVSAAASSPTAASVLAATPSPTGTSVPTAAPSPTAASVSAAAPTPAAPASTPVSSSPASGPVDEFDGVDRSDWLLPEGVTLVFDFRPASMLSGLSSMGGGVEGLDGLTESFRSETGIDIGLVEYAQMFMPAGSLMSVLSGLDEDEADVGLVLYGEFDEAEIVSRSESGGYGGSVYRGYSVYAETDEYGQTTVLGFVGSGVMVIGTDSGVRAVLDVAAGDPVASGGVVDALDSLGERDFGFAVELTSDFSDMAMSDGDGFTPEPEFAGLLGQVLLASPVSAAGILFGDGVLEIELVSLFDDADSADVFREGFEGAEAASGVAVEVVQSGSAVTVRMVLDVADLEHILGDAFTGILPLLPTEGGDLEVYP